jgi:type I protein arginine methyltransferase
MTSREVNQRPQGDTGAGAFVPTYHREMLLDRRRVRAFQRAIESLGDKTKTLIEFGPGTGVLSAFAARHFGSVIAIERDEAMYRIARSNFARQGLLDKNVKLIQGDAMDSAIEPADVIVGELLSTLMIHEPQVPVFNRARAFLKPGGQMIPGLVVNLVTLAWSKFSTEGVLFRSPHSLFTGVAAPERLSESRVFFVADFMKEEVPMTVSKVVEVEALFAGEINSLVLETRIETAPGFTFGGSDSLNPPMVVPVEPLRVSRGDRVRIKVEYAHFSDWDRFRGTIAPA